MSIGPLRRSQVREELGVSDWVLRKILANGGIGRIYIGGQKARGNARAFYCRSDVEILKKKIRGEA